MHIIANAVCPKWWSYNILKQSVRSTNENVDVYRHVLLEYT